MCFLFGPSSTGPYNVLRFSDEVVLYCNNQVAVVELEGDGIFLVFKSKRAVF